jgi:hypothetical protein
MSASIWWTGVIMSVSSLPVERVCGVVGFVLEGMIFSSPINSSRSGMCPPPEPSMWKAWTERPSMAARVVSRWPDSLMESVCIESCTPYSSQAASAASITAG